MERQALQLHIVHTEHRGTAALYAFLPPLVLYSALSAALTALFGAAGEWTVLLPGGLAVCVCALLPQRRVWILRLAIFAGSVLAPVALPAARTGLLLLAERLFFASEAVNDYAYRHFALSSALGTAELRLAWLLFGVLLSVVCSLWRRRICILTLFLGMAFLEAYFGITPGIWLNLLLFVVFAVLLVLRPGEGKSEAALLAGIAAILTAVLLLVPGTIGRVEAWSEHLRDELGAVAMSVERQTAQEEQEENRAHQESRQHEEPVGTEEIREGSLREFEKQQENEQEISLPHRTNYLRIVLLLLLVIVLLIVPFLPFLLLNRAKRRREEKKAAFSDPDNGVAIRAMFIHNVDWLREIGLKTENRPFSRCQAEVEALTDAEYAARYGEVVLIWQEASYSDHPLSDAQRLAVKELLDTTAEACYARANRRTKIRMKYIRCLCGS